MSNWQNNKANLLRPYAIFHHHPFLGINKPKTGEGKKHAGEFGTMTIDNEEGIVRIHDGVTHGGYAFYPFYNTNQANLLPFVPFSPRQVNLLLPINTPTIVPNPLGRLAIVQAVDGAGNVVDVDIRQGVNPPVAPSTTPTFYFEVTQTSSAPNLPLVLIFQ